MTPFRSPFAPTVPSPWGRRSHLGATQAPGPRVAPDDAWARWVQTGANVFRAVSVDSAKLWNALFPDSPVSVPGVGGAASAVGVGESAYDIAQRGPTVQNVAGVTLGSARTVQAGAQLFGEGGSATTGAVGFIGPVTSFIGVGLSAWQVATHPTPLAASSLAVSAAATTGYAASMLGFEGVAAAASLATPMTAVVAIPFVVGAVLQPILRATGLSHAAAHFPGGYVQVTVPGYDAAAVEPTTGKLMLYHDGHYTWAESTLQGVPVSPEQFTAWGVQPMGPLAQHAGYAEVAHFAEEAVATGVPGQRPDLIESYLMQRRAPAIQALHDADPTASPGEIWRQYTLTEDYKNEQPIADLAAMAPRGGDS